MAKRVYTQKIINKIGKTVAIRHLTYNETEETYERPVFIAHLMELEDQFLKENFSVTTRVLETADDRVSD